MIPSLPTYYAIGLLTSVLFYFIGHLLLSFLHWGQRNSFHKAFYKVLCGCICSVFVFAILKTRFQTILLVLIPLSLYFIYHLYRKGKISFDNCKQNIRHIEPSSLLIYALVLLVPTTAFYLHLVNIHGDVVFPSNDYSFYAGVVSKIMNSGIETTDLYNLPGRNATPTFYHYFELWQSGLIVAATKTSAEYALLLCSLPILISITILGAIVIAFQATKNKLISVLLALLLIFIPLPNISWHPFNISVDLVGCLLLSKNAIVFALIIASLLEYRAQDYHLIFFPLSLLSVVFLTTLPAVLCLLTVLTIAIRFNKKHNNTIQLTPYIFIPLVCIPIFYYITRNTLSNCPIETSLFYQLTNVYSDSEGWIRLIKVIIKSCYFFLQSLIIWGLLLFIPGCFCFVKKHREKLVLLFTIAILTLAGTCIIFFMENSGQLFSMFWQPAFIIGIYVIIVHGIKAFSKAYFVLIPLLCIVIYYSYSLIEQRSSVLKELSDFHKILQKELKDSPTVVYMNDVEDYGRYDAQFQLWSKAITYTIPYPELRRCNNNYFPICISVFEIPKLETPKEWLYLGKAIYSSPFYQYVIQNDLKNDIDNAKYQYLKRNRIQYIMANPNNEWFNKVNLPIDTIFSSSDNQYNLIKLVW